MARVFFRKGQPGFRLVRGLPIFEVQRVLKSAAFLAESVDGVFGNDTEQALRRFQADRNIDVNGVIDLPTWQRAVSASPPDLFARCLQLTADFEGHGFGLVQGNFDHQGLTWGIIGFTLVNGEIGGIVRAADATSPQLVDGAFAGLAGELRARLSGSPAQLEAWGDSISIGPKGAGVAEPWKTAFYQFGELAAVQTLQLERARQYWATALGIAGTYGLATELGHALAFDIAVQNGSVKPEVAARIDAARQALGAEAAELELRRVIANCVAEGSAAEWIENVRRRKLAIATGYGAVNGSEYALADWGLADVAA
jgi:peptidoglycan hydrolase-like protein with peptidoglycan-binding domain